MVGQGREWESDTTGAKSWLSHTVSVTWDSSNWPGSFLVLKRKVLHLRNPLSPRPTGSAGHLRPGGSPTAILSFSFHTCTEGSNTYFAKAVRERKAGMHVNGRTSTHLTDTHPVPDAAARCRRSLISQSPQPRGLGTGVSPILQRRPGEK